MSGRTTIRDRLPASRHRSLQNSSEHFDRLGLASVYMDQMTASGEQMHSTDMTAAHRTLPFGTVVTVINRRTGHSVDVRINDRGPFVQSRLIDLSPAAAEALEVNGLAPVIVIINKQSTGGD